MHWPRCCCSPDPRLHVADGAGVATMLSGLQQITGTSEHVELIASCLRALELSRLSRQLAVLDDLLAKHPGRVAGAS